MTVFRSLRNASFLLLWIGQTISRLGDSVYRIALAWWVLEKTNSAAAMGTILAFSFVPTILFSLIGGVTVDKGPRLRLMLLTDLLRGTVVTAIAVLASVQLLEPWHVYIGSMIFGAVEAFFQPAYTSAIPELVSQEDLASANALTSLSGYISNVAGPALGAWVISASGTASAFAFDAASFFVSAAFLLPLLGRIVTTSDQLSPSLMKGLREGIQWVISSPWLWITISIAALGNITISGPLKVALPFRIKDELQAGIGSLGFVYSMLAVGAAAGTLMFSGRAAKPKRGLGAYLAWMFGGLMILSIGLPVRLPGVCLAALGAGALFSIFSIVWTTTLQEHVPRNMLGRVASIDNFGSYALVPLGYSLTGWLTDRVGASAVFLIAGGLTAILALLGLSNKAIRELD